MKKIFIFVFCLALSACANQKIWVYNAGQKIIRTPLINKSVSVPDFGDTRLSGCSNMKPLSLIPLVPYGTLTLNTPEKLCGSAPPSWLCNPPQDFAKATAAELENSGIFKEVFYSNRRSDADLSIIGTIKSTQLKQTLFNYGVSFAGAYLWLLGFPQFYNKNELMLHLALVDNKNNNIIWEHAYNGSFDQCTWIYDPPQPYYDELLKKALQSAITDIQTSSAVFK
jgi:hypothetical protein